MTSETDRISVHFRKNIRDAREHYSSMFMDDFCNNVGPKYGPQNDLVDCRLDPENKEFSELLKKGLPSHNHYDRNLTDVIIGSIEFIAYYLVHYGSITLEIVKQREKNTEKWFRLVSIPGEENKIVGNRVLQIIPNDVAERLNISKTVVIPLEKCFNIDFPLSLGGKTKYLKFLSKLKTLGHNSPMMKYLDNPLSGQAGYNIIDHQGMHNIEMWKKSKEYCWPHREYSGKIFSGYYHIYRHLNFRKKKIELRDYIIEQLKMIIADLADQAGFQAELVIDGLVSINQIEEKIEEYRIGELDPKSISNIL